jgi:hypothetical protein
VNPSLASTTIDPELLARVERLVSLTLLSSWARRSQAWPPEGSDAMSAQFKAESLPRASSRLFASILTLARHSSW